MRLKRLVQTTCLIGAVVMLIGFISHVWGTDVPAYRYRIDIGLTTPQGAVHRSGVVEVRSGIKRILLDSGGYLPEPFVTRFFVDADYEAIPLDLPGRPGLFAIPRNPAEFYCDPELGNLEKMNEKNWPKFRSFRHGLDEALDMRRVVHRWGGDVENPYVRRPGQCTTVARGGLIFVEVDNAARPSKIRLMKPYEFAKDLGPGFGLTEITLRPTDEPLPRSRILSFAPWLREFPNGRICDSRPEEGLKGLTEGGRCSPLVDFWNHPVAEN